MITREPPHTKLLIGIRICTCLLPTASLLICSLLLIACNKNEPPPPKPTPVQPKFIRPVTLGEKANVSLLWQKLDAAVEKNLDTSALLEQQILRFLYAPNTAHLNNAQDSWFKARASYESLYFYIHLYSAAPNSSSINLAWHQQLGAWPIQPGMLDRFGTYKFSGLVFDIGVPLTPESLLSMHQATESDEVIIGLYAIEYLLFGGGSPRTYGEFSRRKKLGSVEKEAGFEAPNELPTERRRQLLRVQAELLTPKMKEAAHFWQSEKTFNALSSLTQQDITNSCVTFIAQHLIALSEMEKTAPWEQKQTLHRIYTQLVSWLELLPEIMWLEVDTLLPLTSKALNQMKEIIGTLQNSQTEQVVTVEQRKLLYQNLNQIAQILRSTPTPEEEPSESDALKEGDASKPKNASAEIKEPTAPDTSTH